jgi:hypothetical protein
MDLDTARSSLNWLKSLGCRVVAIDLNRKLQGRLLRFQIYRCILLQKAEARAKRARS